MAIQHNLPNTFKYKESIKQKQLQKNGLQDDAFENFPSQKVACDVVTNLRTRVTKTGMCDKNNQMQTIVYLDIRRYSLSVLVSS